MELDIGVIVMFGGNFAMSGYAFCDGQLLAISTNTALFSILGTTYGGNGQTNFALPDLRGRVALHSGGSQGPGLSPYTLGQQGGTEAVTLTTGQMPGHNHTLVVDNSPSTTAAPSNGAFIGQGPSTGSGPNATQLKIYTADTSHQITLNPQSIGISGGNQPHPNIQPYLAVNFVIALQGIFPSRN
jgi:microcystin-dependent protein